MGGDETGKAGIGLLLAVVVLASTAVVPAGAYSCAVEKSYHMAGGSGDGSLVFLDGDDVEVRDAAPSWHDEERQDIEGAWPDDDADDDVAVRAFARGPTGDWWLVGSDGRVVRFAENWTFTGEWSWFAHRDAGTDDVANVDGQWWMLRENALVGYDENWSRVEVHHLGGDHTGLTAAEGSLWTIEGDGTVTQFDVEDGEPQAVTTREGAVGRELRNPEDLHRDADGDWWVLSEGGGVAEYSPAWEHTGYQYGDVEDTLECGTRGSNVPETLGLYLLVAVGGVVATVKTNRGVKTTLARGGLAVGSFLGGFALYDYSAPGLLSWLHRLPDVAVSAPLVSVAVLVSVVPSLVRDDRSVVDALVLAALTSPLVVVALLY